MIVWYLKEIYAQVPPGGEVGLDRQLGLTFGEVNNENSLFDPL